MSAEISLTRSARRYDAVIDAIENLPIPTPVRNNGDKILFFAFAIPIAKRILIDCAGQTCGGLG